MLSISIDQVRSVLEATATFAEFMAAHTANYSGLPDMERGLPLEYREWRAIYDDVFQPSIPHRARWYLADHLSRSAMDTAILSDYADLSDEKISAFSAYLGEPENSPEIRLSAILDHVKRADQERLFENFLREYRRTENELVDAYQTRSFDARKRSLKIQSDLRRAYESDARSIPVAAPSLIIPPNFEPLANAVINGWKSYAKQSRGETFEYFFRSTDEDEVDQLFENEVVVFEPTPQSGLYHLPAIAHLPNSHAYVASVIEWLDPEPFLLSESPKRFLAKGDCYARLLPTSQNMPTYFIISHDRSLIRDLFHAKVAATLFRGRNYRDLRTEIAPWRGDELVIAHWASWSELAAQVDLQPPAGTMAPFQTPVPAK